MHSRPTLHSFRSWFFRADRIVPAAVILYGFIMFFDNAFGLFDPARFKGDVAYHLFWTPALHDPALFRNDLLAVHARHFQSPGMIFVHWLGGFFLSAPTVWKLGQLALGLVYLAVTIAATGAIFKSNKVARWLAAVLLIRAEAAAQLTVGGLARGWSMSLPLIWIWGATRGRGIIVGLSLILASLFYPTFFVAGSIASIVLMALDRRFRAPRQAAAICIPALIAAALIAGTKGTSPPEIGPALRYDRARPHPIFLPGAKFGQEGAQIQINIAQGLALTLRDAALKGFDSDRAPIDALWRKMFERPLNRRVKQALIAAVILGAGLAGVYWRRRHGPRTTGPDPHVRMLATSCGALFAGGVIAWAAARSTAFLFFVPDRHLNGITMAITMLAIAAWYSRVLSARGLAAALIALCIVVNPVQKLGNWKRLDQDDMAMMQWLRDHTDKSAIVAGMPESMDPVPSFALRPCLVTNEFIAPYYATYFEQIEARLNDLIPALLSPEANDARPLAKRWGVRYLIVSRDDLARRRAGKSVIVQPYQNQFRARFGRDIKSWTETAPKNAVVYENKNWRVIDLGILFRH